MSDTKMTVTARTTEDLLYEIAALSEKNIDLENDVSDLEADLFEATSFEPNNDRLAPLELAPICSATTLDDLDWRAKAVAGGWHSDEETREHIMALARAVPRLTAELRKRGAVCS